MSPPISLLAYVQKWWQVLSNGIDGRSVDVSTLVISGIVVKQINFNGGTFSMFSIVETLRNYFTHELQLDYLSQP